jgi:hypothetical protein
MKLERISLIVAAALALELAGCSKNDPTTRTAEDSNKAATSAANAAEAAKAAEAGKTEAARVADVAKAEAAKVAEAAKTADAATTDAATTDGAKAADYANTQGLIDKAKSLLAEGKYSDAASVLQQLAGQSLSVDQTTLVDGLKEQIQRALAAKAAGNAADNLLKK